MQPGPVFTTETRPEDNNTASRIESPVYTKDGRLSTPVVHVRPGTVCQSAWLTQEHWSYSINFRTPSWDLLLFVVLAHSVLVQATANYTSKCHLTPPLPTQPTPPLTQSFDRLILFTLKACCRAILRYNRGAVLLRNIGRLFIFPCGVFVDMYLLHTWPVRRQACGYLPSRSALRPFSRYHINPFGSWGVWSVAGGSSLCQYRL